ncbi:MAG: single-stranded DNA-binding protein [Bacillota bacterium]|jgi:single-strand DNA-binding protein
MLNQVVLIGRLTRDPEMRYTASAGIPVLRFTLAVDRRFNNAQGEKQTDFIDIVCWRRLAENCHRYLRKGLLTAVVGSLQIRTYETNDGQKRKAAEVVADDVRFLEWPKDGSSAPPAAGSFGDFGSEIDLDEEEEENDLPF